jgi:UDP-N-acetylmuramoyl-L-alanyl-D-glutamate--2,6-diaminopimelate ligase
MLNYNIMTLKSFIRKLIPPALLVAYHYLLAFLGASAFGFPSKSLTVIGVTGTSGKSTTVDLISRILSEAGYKVASTSTARFKIGDKEWENKYKMTMPGRFVVQKFIRQAKKEGCKFVILEVTSEGIRQFRHKFINFDTAVFTNLTPEHIESHGGFENYRNEKLKLFKAVKNIHVVNADDENAKYFLDILAKEKITFSIKDVQDIEIEEDETRFAFNATRFTTKLAGRFNIYNALAAISVGKAYNINLEICKKALEKAKGIPGRMEIIAKKPFTVIVDYAHTPEQLELVYKTLTSNQKPVTKKLICVLGSCGGGRDKWKRPVLGEIAKKYCSEIIVTNEDPYDENPMEIINQVAESVEGKAQKILDRKEAIQKAISMAKPGDIVAITGKGSEPWMCVANGKKIPWSDQKIAKEALV